MPNTGKSVSCVLIAKDEARRIARCLANLRWADEVVVVDDESSDGTSEICRTHGARVVVHPSHGDFDRQRNLGTDTAQGPWILQLDADEIVPAPLAGEIRRRIEQDAHTPSSPVAYRIGRNNYFLGRRMRHGGWAGPGEVKLFRKGQARYVGHGVHETLYVQGPVGTLAARSDHHPFSSIEQFIDRQNFYTSVEAPHLTAWVARDMRRFGRYTPLARGLKIFLKIYVKKRGFLDGRHGLVFALLYGWVAFVQWAKAWELLEKQHADPATHHSHLP